MNRNKKIMNVTLIVDESFNFDMLHHILNMGSRKYYMCDADGSLLKMKFNHVIGKISDFDITFIQNMSGVDDVMSKFNEKA